MDLLQVEERTYVSAAGTTSVLRPNVSREDAIALLKTAGARKWRWVRRSSPLRSVAEFYVPFQIFRATIRHRATEETRIIAVDLVCGILDPFTFPHLPADDAFIQVRTRNSCPPLLSTSAAEKALRTKLQRLLFQFGFFRVGDLKIDVEPLKVAYMPYWLGFFGAGDQAAIEVLDATRRVREGAKFRRVVQEWIVQHDARPPDPILY
jgi:hypothetical protein